MSEQENSNRGGDGKARKFRYAQPKPSQNSPNKMLKLLTLKDLDGRTEAARKAVQMRNAIMTDDVVAIAPELDHLRNHLGRVLQVGVDDHDCIAGRFFQSGSDGDLVAEVARQQQHANVRVDELEFSQNRLRVVATAVVDEEQFVIQRQCGEDRRQTLVSRAQHVLFVVAGNDN